LSSKKSISPEGEPFGFATEDSQIDATGIEIALESKDYVLTVGGDSGIRSNSKRFRLDAGEPFV
jgi:hypothetical protein